MSRASFQNFYFVDEFILFFCSTGNGTHISSSYDGHPNLNVCIQQLRSQVYTVAY